MAAYISSNHSLIIFLKSCWQKVKEKDSLGSSLEVGDLLPGTAYTLLLWRENRWTCLSIAMIGYGNHNNNNFSATAKATLLSWLSQHSKSR